MRTSTGVVLPVPRSTLVGAAVPVSRRAVAGIAVRRTERGLALALSGDVLFDFDRADLSASALPVLTELAALIRARRPNWVRIEGHTDAVGIEAYNLDLDRLRAEAVRDHLVRRHRLDSALFSVASFGESRPVAPNTHTDGRDDPEVRQKNRRVEGVLEQPGGFSRCRPSSTSKRGALPWRRYRPCASCSRSSWQPGSC